MYIFYLLTWDVASYCITAVRLLNYSHSKRKPKNYESVSPEPSYDQRSWPKRLDCLDLTEHTHTHVKGVFVGVVLSTFYCQSCEELITICQS